jgi:hypothetical protein
MLQRRDLNRARERIMTAAQKEFPASRFAGALTDAIAHYASVSERMSFGSLRSKGLFRLPVLTKTLSAQN